MLRSAAGQSTALQFIRNVFSFRRTSFTQAKQSISPRLTCSGHIIWGGTCFLCMKKTWSYKARNTHQGSLFPQETLLLSCLKFLVYCADFTLFTSWHNRIKPLHNANLLTYTGAKKKKGRCPVNSTKSSLHEQFDFFFIFTMKGKSTRWKEPYISSIK